MTTAPDPNAQPRGLPGSVRRFRLSVVEGPARGLDWTSTTDRCSMGSHPSNTLVLQDPTVSRFHCEIQVDGQGARVRDLGSRNGTALDGVVIVEAFLRIGSLLRLGKTVVRFDYGAETNRLLLSEQTRLGNLIGVSIPMRAAFAIIERAATCDAAVLIEGETGTGKSQAAYSIHAMSSRKSGPFTVVDCGTILDNLLESELFGHEKGSFTGATERRIGAFEEASGGTLFLDEIGELPLDLQVKLLRALESREIRRVGANVYHKVDVRVIAATNRDLRAEVNAGRFRADLYFRLAVLTMELPPLRQRPEDIPPLLDEILHLLRATEPVASKIRSAEFVAHLQRAVWPGNVRELRNYVERCSILQTLPPVPSDDSSRQSSFHVNASVPYSSERERVLLEFERAYIDELVQMHGGRVAQAADAAGMERTYLYRLLRRHGIKP